MTSNTKISMAVLAVVVVVVTGILLLNRPDTPDATAGDQPPAAQLVRPDSHRLSTAADGKVTVVEFLDLECQACGAAYPGVERLRADYSGKVTFVMRYFPIPSHRNAELAARAVEAAGQQGKLEAMYKLMYETQPLWGNQNVAHRDTFLGFAGELGLDLPKFEKALDAKATIDRVMADRTDGVALGVQGTPTFFVNGTKFTGRPTYEALKATVDAELSK
jgi:protein-disulfide isomerase